jgi:hypothetical protein
MRESRFACELFAACCVAMTELFLRRFPAARHETWEVEDSNDMETLRRGVWVSSQIGCIQMSVSDSLVTSVDFEAKYPHLSTCTASKCRKAGISDVTP